MSTRNCWEVKGCGRERGGAKANDLGVCPAASEERVDGINGGRNGGRVCWMVAGTMCGGKVQGSYAAKLASCTACEFYAQVHREQGRDAARPTRVLELLY